MLSISESPSSSSYGITSTVSVLNVPTKFSSTMLWPASDSESRPPIDVMSYSMTSSTCAANGSATRMATTHTAMIALGCLMMNFEYLSSIISL